MVSAAGQGQDMLSQLLKNAGYTDIRLAESGSDTRRIINDTEYDIVIVNTPLHDEFGHELSMMIAENSSAGVILICKADIADDVCEKVECYGVCVVPKPLNKSVFFQSLRIVAATRARMLGLQNENFKLQTKIEEIRLVNRAKCVLIQYLKLTEPQAHRYIEKQAMDTRQTKREVAQRILTTYET